MRFKIAIVIIMQVTVFSCDTAINDMAFDERVFFKFYGGEYIEEGFDVIESHDQGYLIVGTTTSSKMGRDQDILIVKTDRKGNAKWTKTIGGSGEDIARKIKRLSDGFIVVGDFSVLESGTQKKQIFLARFDLHGIELWRRTYGYHKGSESFEVEGMDVALNHDGNFLVVGNVILSSLDKEILFFVTNGNGDQIGERTLIGQENTIEHAKSVLPDPSGINLAYVAGYTNYGERQGQEGYNLFISNINKDGSVPFPNIIGGATDEFGEMMIQTTDNKFMILGSEIQGSTSKAFLKKLNLKLDTEWTRYLDVKGMEQVKGISMCRTSEGYILLAEGKITSINSKIVLVKVDENGNMLWDEEIRVFGGDYYDKGNSITTDILGNILITGKSSFTALGSNAKMCLIKTRDDGMLKP